MMLASSPGPLLLDLSTLILVGTSMAGLLGLFLLSVSAQECMRALAWWGSAYLLGGVAVAIWTVEDRISPPVPFGLPNALLFVACGMIWSAARIFHGRKVFWAGMFAGATLWLAACTMTEAMQLAAARMMLSSLVVSIYTLLTAAELWRERRKTVLHRWPAVFVPVMHAAVLLAPISLATLLPPDGEPNGVASRWLALFGLEIMLYMVGSAFIILLLAKERSLRLYQDAAFTDELTGSFNRRGFFVAAERLLFQQKRTRAPLSVLIFDLDQFKTINDRYGHAIGDEALKLFAVTARKTLRASDLFARFGGEEFVVMLPGSLGEATAAAERVRRAFERAAVSVAGCTLGATVSVGAASTPRDASVATLLTTADRALYRAKANGRNRTEGVEQAPAPSSADRKNPSGGYVAQQLMLRTAPSVTA
jgi:diguanylate cyclase (GGDEF)-like protein